MRALAILLVWLSGSGCALDREVALRSELSGWLFLAQTRVFESRAACTVAVFDLVSPELKGRAPSVAATLDEAMQRIRAARPVRFAPGQSPDAISRAVMSRDLAPGLGLLSTGVGPAKACMEDWVARGFHRVLLSDSTVTVYDPGRNALLLVYPPESLAFFLRRRD